MSNNSKKILGWFGIPTVKAHPAVETATCYCDGLKVGTSGAKYVGALYDGVTCSIDSFRTICANAEEISTH